MHLSLQLGCLLPNGPPLSLMWAGLAELCCVREGNMKQSRGHTMEKKRHPAASRLPLTCYKQVRESEPPVPGMGSGQPCGGGSGRFGCGDNRSSQG